MRRRALTRHSMGLTLFKGRNADRPIQEVAAVGGGQILRMSFAGAGPVVPPINAESFPPLPAPGEPV
eukprot:2979269-Heterocapsa_arctica.AAC.2